MRKLLRTILSWNFWVDLPIVTRCPRCEGGNSMLLSELSVSRPERWVCGHCGAAYVVTSQDLDHAITAMFSAFFGY